MVQTIMVNGIKIKKMVMEHINGVMEILMLEIGNKEKDVAQENIIGLMETSILEIGFQIEDKDKV